MGLCALAALLACGKERLSRDVEPWEAPTEANGFFPVRPDEAHNAPCVKRVEPFETRPLAKTPLATASSVTAIVADEDYAYWIDTQEHRYSVAGTTIERVVRADGRRLRIAMTEGVAQDLAIDQKSIYWSTVGGPGKDAIWSWDKATGHLEIVALERAGRLVARGWIVAWTRMRPDGVGEVRTFGSPSTAYRPAHLTPVTVATIPDLVDGLLAIDGLTVYAASKEAIWAIPTVGDAKPKKIVSTQPPDDLAADSGWVWWIERGPARAVCDADGSNPTIIGHRDLKHPVGMLKRVKSSGGSNEVLATHIVEAHTLTVERDVAWIATPSGVLRVVPYTEPTLEPLRPTVRLAPTNDGLVASAYGIGEETIALLRWP